MTVSYGFYNSVANDRVYSAEAMSRLFDGIITDGVFNSIGTALVVGPGTGMEVIVGSGRAWFNHTWTYNDAPLVLSLDLSEVVLNRIDVVVLEVNTDSSTRANTIKIIKGTPASVPVAPNMVNTSTVHQYPLAHISVLAGVTSIGGEKITNKVGTPDCPFITGILESLDLSTYLTQYSSEFNVWFNAMKDQLTSDAAGNLQTQINNIAITPIGTVMEITGDRSLPSGWLYVDGEAVNRTTYAGLFGELGVNHGPGNGTTTFDLPDIQDEVFSYLTGTSIPATRYFHSLNKLSDGRLLIIGGYNGSVSTNNTYFGTISGNTITWVAGTPLANVRHAHGIVILSDGRIMIVGGNESGSRTGGVLFGTISGNTITWVAGSTPCPTSASPFGTLSYLSDGRVLVIGGSLVSGVTANTYFGTISGNTVTWVAGTSLPTVNYMHSTLILADGRVLVLGGHNGTNPLSNTYFGTISGNTITWVAGTSLPVAQNGMMTFLVSKYRFEMYGGTINAANGLLTAYNGRISGNRIFYQPILSMPEGKYAGAGIQYQGKRLLLTGGLDETATGKATSFIISKTSKVIKT